MVLFVVNQALKVLLREGKFKMIAESTGLISCMADGPL